MLFFSEEMLTWCFLETNGKKHHLSWNFDNEALHLRKVILSGISVKLLNLLITSLISKIHNSTNMITLFDEADRTTSLSWEIEYEMLHLKKLKLTGKVVARCIYYHYSENWLSWVVIDWVLVKYLLPKPCFHLYV